MMRLIISHITSRRRGGSFFTMLIFIMMLLSCALMYYYFQRTRVLENEVAALRKGETPVAEGLSSWIPWTKSDATNPTAISDSTNPVSEEPLVSDQSEAVAPEPSATPTPTPTIDTMAPQMGTLAPLTTETLNVADPETAPETAPETSSETTDEEPEQPAETPENPPKKIDSVYDTQPPPVRVRSPRR